MIKGALNAASSCISPILLAVEGFLCSDYWTFITYNYCDRIYSMMRIIRKRQSGSGEPLKPFISCANLIQSRLPCISFSSRMFSGHWYTGRCSSLRVNQLPNSCSGRYLFWLFPLCIEIVHFVGNLYWPFTSKQELQNPLPGENGGKREKKKSLCCQNWIQQNLHGLASTNLKFRTFQRVVNETIKETALSHSVSNLWLESSIGACSLLAWFEPFPFCSNLHVENRARKWLEQPYHC